MEELGTENKAFKLREMTLEDSLKKADEGVEIACSAFQRAVDQVAVLNPDMNFNLVQLHHEVCNEKIVNPRMGGGEIQDAGIIFSYLE